MNAEEYRKASDELGEEFQRKTNEIDKEYHKDFKRKYYKNSEHLIALASKDSEGFLEYYYMGIDGKYPTFYDIDFSRGIFGKTEVDFIVKFGEKHSGDTPVEITKEEFIEGVMSRVKEIVEGHGLIRND